MKRLVVLVAFGALAVAAPAVAQMQTPSTTSTTVAGGSSSVTFGVGSSVPSSGVTTPPLPAASPVVGGTTSTPVPARTGPNAPQELAVGLLVLMAGAVVVKGMPKPGRHARGYRP